MRTTVTIDDALLAKAAELTGVTESVALLRQGLQTLIRVESARRLAALGGTDSQASAAPLGGGRLTVILVDTSIWIDHLHTDEALLVSLLAIDEIGCHHLVIEELALGTIKQRDVVLPLLSNLRQFPMLTHAEILHLVERRRLWGKGLSVIDVNLLGAVALVEGAQLWTRDKRFKAACENVGLGPKFGNPGNRTLTASCGTRTSSGRCFRLISACGSTGETWRAWSGGPARSPTGNGGGSS